MPSNWPQRTLGEVSVCNTETYSPKERWPFVNYLDTGNITRGQIEAIQHINSNDKLPSRARRKVRPGDIVYSTVRPNQRHYGIISQPHENMLASTGFVVLRGIDGVSDTRFLYYYLTQDQVVEYLHSIGENSTSAYPSVKPSDIQALRFNLPPLPTQRRIASILGSLDDTIELNRRMNRTLERMAQALFKSWFIDFGPVRAKAAGDPTAGGLPATIAALFPDRLADSDLGEIPEGWEVKALGDEFRLTMGQSPPGETYNEERRGEPFFQGRRDFGFRYPTNRVYCTAPTRFAAKDDTLLSVRAPVGDVNMAFDRCAVGRGVAAVRHNAGSRSYTYYAFQSLQRRFEVYNGEGTVFGSISQKDLKAMPWCAPDEEIVAAFHELVNPIDERIEIGETQTRRLAGLRDTLLPKLLSGELEAPEAEDAVEEVVES